MSRFGYKKENASELIQIRIEPSLKEDLKRLAKNEGIAMAKYIKYLILEEVDKKYAEARETIKKIEKREI